jgi:hypothetical protein
LIGEPDAQTTERAVADELENLVACGRLADVRLHAETVVGFGERPDRPEWQLARFVHRVKGDLPGPLGDRCRERTASDHLVVLARVVTDRVPFPEGRGDPDDRSAVTG